MIMRNESNFIDFGDGDSQLKNYRITVRWNNILIENLANVPWKSVGKNIGAERRGVNDHVNNSWC